MYVMEAVILLMISQIEYAFQIKKENIILHVFNIITRTKNNNKTYFEWSYMKIW